MRSLAVVSVLLRTVRLLVVLCSTAVSTWAFAYPATQGTTYRNIANSCASVGTYTGSTASQVCEAGKIAGARFYWGSCSANITATVTSVQDTGGGVFNCLGNIFRDDGYQQYTGVIVGQVESVTGYTCPNGGTLSGQTCVCPAGFTDNGTGCVEDPACPSGQFKRLPTSACEDKCPQNRAMGPYAFPSGVSSFCAQRQDYVNTSTTGTNMQWVPVTAYSSSTPNDPIDVVCEVRATDAVMACGDNDSGGVTCFTDTSRSTGTVCGDNAKADIPVDTVTPTVCEAGDEWCKNTTGTCASGFVSGNFNGQSLCVKSGSDVTTTTQPKSSLAPATPDDISNPPSNLTPAPDGSAGDEKLRPADRVVVGVGPNAAKVAAGGGGSGGSATDIITCGLPDTPKCKIDETGTPTSGSFGDAQTALNDATKARQEGLATVTSAEGKNTSWGWNLQLPTGCQAISLNMIVKTVVIDPCLYQSVIHDLMSLVWAGATLFAVFGMVGRTLRES